MIYIDDNNNRKPYMTNFKLCHGDDIIDRVRCIYKVDEEIRECSIPVVDENGKLIYFASWVSNNNNPPQDIKDVLYVPEFWDYSLENSILDREILDRYDAYEFEKVDEYSIFLTRVISKYYKDKKIVFYDDNAKYFFNSNNYPTVSIVTDKKFEQHLELNKTLYLFTGEVYYDHNIRPNQVNQNKLTTLSAIISVLWQNDRVSYGDKNPDKVFYLIKSKLGMQGLSDLIKFCLYRVDMAKNRKDIIPIIDMCVPGDNNQFNYGDGTNAWTMLFKQVSDFDLTQVYQSKNVIIGKEQIFSFNPYLAESRFSKDFSELINEYLVLNDSMKKSNEKALKETITVDVNKVLGVIARGTDYKNPAVAAAGVIKKPCETKDLIARVKEVCKEKGFTHIFLATEDQEIFDEFMSSDLKDTIYYVDQNRYTYGQLKTGLLSDYYNENKVDTWNMNTKYLGIIYILSKCGGLLTSTSCGSYQIATGLNDHKYSFNEILNEK